MKRCPKCRRDYTDETLNFCVDDGTALLEGPASGGSGASRTEAFFVKPGTAVYQGNSGSTHDQSAAVCPEVDENGESTIYTEQYPLNDLWAGLSPLIGRESELREVLELLGQADIRLLTITGIGGTGKTRLAQCIAHNAVSLFPDGVHFIGLSAIESIGLVVPIIAQSLGVREEAGKSLQVSMHEYLRQKRLLIILDNFEQITGAATPVGELLSGAINTKIIVTSRVRLHLRVEHEYPLQPLALPADGEVTVNELASNPAIALFVDRATSVKPAFALTKTNVQSIAGICRRLDGLPLAIELAAVRIKLLAPQAILTRLSSSLKLLTGGARDLPERQQTIRGTIQWSYDLLDADEQKLLSRLAVFAGGFTLDAAEAVANAGGDLNVDLLDGVASLVDKSLLIQREMPDGEPRFRMLEVVREFSLEALEAKGEGHKVREIHGEFFARMTERAEPELFDEKGPQWMELLEQEHDNLRSAIEWGLAHRPETALRIAGAVLWFWYGHGHLSQGIKWTKKALDNSDEAVDTKLRAKAYLALGVLSSRKGEVNEAEQFAREGLRLAREIDDKTSICSCLSILGVVKLHQDDLVQAKSFTEEALVIGRELNNRRIMSGRLNALGEIARRQDDYQAAREFYEEALALGRQQSAKMFVVSPALNLAAVACYQEDHDAALGLAHENLITSEELGDKIFTGLALGVIAACAVATGSASEAARLFGAVEEVFEGLGTKLEKVDQVFIDDYIGRARAVLGEEQFDDVFEEGRAMTLQKAAELAREIRRQVTTSTNIKTRAETV